MHDTLYAVLGVKELNARAPSCDKSVPRTGDVMPREQVLWFALPPVRLSISYRYSENFSVRDARSRRRYELRKNRQQCQ